MKNKNFDLEEKDIYKLFNGIKFEESEITDMKEEVSTVQKERIKKNLNKKIKSKRNLKKLKYTPAVAAIGLACLVGIGTISPTFAENIPVLKSIIQALNDDKGEYDKYSQIINSSITDNGITLTINEVIADESKLMIGYTIKSNKKITDLAISGPGSSLQINGEDFYGIGGRIGGRTEDRIDDYTYVVSEEWDISLLKPWKKLDLDLKFNEVAGVKGKWDFAFSVSKEEISRNSTIFTPNKKLDFPDSAVTVDKVVFSPIGTYISLSGKHKEKKSTPHNIFDYDYWLAFDDKGTQLIPNGIGGGGSNGLDFNSQMSYTKVKDIPKYLTIIPCKITPSGGGGVSDDGTPITVETKKSNEISKPIDGVYPIELPQGKLGKLIIKEIKTDNNKTTVTFTAEGKAPYLQATSLYIKNDSGKMIDSKDDNIRRDEQKPNEFTMEFEALDANKKYHIGTNDFDNFELREDLKFKIDLN